MLRWLNKANKEWILNKCDGFFCFENIINMRLQKFILLPRFNNHPPPFCKKGMSNDPKVCSSIRYSAAQRHAEFVKKHGIKHYVDPKLKNLYYHIKDDKDNGNDKVENNKPPFEDYLPTGMYESIEHFEPGNGKKLKRSLLEEGISELSDLERDIILKEFYENKRQNVIVEETGRDRKTVKKYRANALGELKIFVDNYQRHRCPCGKFHLCFEVCAKLPLFPGIRFPQCPTKKIKKIPGFSKNRRNVYRR